MSVQVRFSSCFSSNIDSWTRSQADYDCALTVNETLKTAHATAHLDAEVILVVTV